MNSYTYIFDVQKTKKKKNKNTNNRIYQCAISLCSVQNKLHITFLVNVIAKNITKKKKKKIVHPFVWIYRLNKIR